MTKALYIVVDALRFDVLRDAAARRLLAPTLSRLIDRGFVRRVVANAQGTEFVMPALHSLTYPLDYGGYNTGIRERPKSLGEALRDAGFETHMIVTASQIGVTMGYDRGYDTFRCMTDYRGLLRERITRTLKYDIDLWRQGARGEAETIDIIQREFGMLLERLDEMIERHDKSFWPRALWRINSRVSRGIAAERRLLADEPSVVLHKLAWVPGSIYWRFLGERSVNRTARFFWAAIAALKLRTRSYIAARRFPPFFLLSHYPGIAGDAIGAIRQFLVEAKDRHWFAYLHLIDVHDCRALNRPLHVLGRLRYLPRWWLARGRALTNRRWVYDTAVSYVDAKLGRIVRELERTGQLDDTVILVTGDHGYDYAEGPRKRASVGWRTHYEDIETPLVLCGSERVPIEDGLIDSMGVTATFLDALDVPLHESFKGISAFRGGRPGVVTESCGSGNADVERRDIFFTVTTQEHRMMTLLKGDRIETVELYDLRSDPREIDNLVDDPDQGPVIEALLGHLERERSELLTSRGVMPRAPAAG